MVKKKKENQDKNFKMLSYYLKYIFGAASIIVAIAGAGWTANQYLTKYALAEDLNALKQEYHVDKLFQRYEKVQERVWKYQDHFGMKLEKADNLSKQEYKELQKELDELKNEIDKEKNSKSSK